MRLLFLDESGRIGQDGLFALGGVAVRADDWRALREAWLAPLTAADWDPANEVKWHGIRSGYVPPALADSVVDVLSTPERLTLFVESAGATTRARHRSAGLGEDVRLHGEGVVGSGLELEGELLQLCAFRSDERSGRMARPSRRR